MSPTTRLAGVLAALTTGLTVAATTAPTHAAPSPREEPVTAATGLLSPLSIATTQDGTRYISQNFGGTLLRQRPGGKPTPIYTSKDHDEAGAVSVHGGVVTFATTERGGALLLRRSRSGEVTTVANLSRYEKRQNPDGDVAYGFRSLSKACAAKLPKAVPASYTGLVDSHPYSSTTADGTTYVADAAGNDILGVGPAGRIRTVAVLPRVPVRVTEEGAKANELPACTVGKTYWFESVPTDVEVGRDGRLYVSTLPGGPEDGSLGAHAQVLRVDARTGVSRLVAGGLTSATGLAVARNGDIYVAELFAGRIAWIPHGTHRVGTFARVPLPGDVELAPRGLLVTKNVLTGTSDQPGDEPRGAVVLYPF